MISSLTIHRNFTQILLSLDNLLVFIWCLHERLYFWKINLLSHSMSQEIKQKLYICWEFGKCYWMCPNETHLQIFWNNTIKLDLNLWKIFQPFTFLIRWKLLNLTKTNILYYNCSILLSNVIQIISFSLLCLHTHALTLISAHAHKYIHASTPKIRQFLFVPLYSYPNSYTHLFGTYTQIQK